MSFQNEKGELKKQPLGTHWINSANCREYDGGMAVHAAPRRRRRQ
jgi:hypothetical protein